MALVQKKISKGKQLRLALALTAVIGTTLAVAYFGLIKRSGPGPDSTVPASSKVRYFRLPNKTGFEAADELNDVSLFGSLRSFGIWPLPLEPKGRSQPFISDAEQEEEQE